MDAVKATYGLVIGGGLLLLSVCAAVATEPQMPASGPSQANESPGSEGRRAGTSEPDSAPTAVGKASGERGMTPTADTREQTASKPKQAATKEVSRKDFRPQDKKLAGRVEARWQSLVAGDFDAAYGYMLPSYRQTHTLEQYRGGFGNAVRWRVATVQGIRYDSPEIAHVRLNLTVEYVPSWGGQAERLVTRLNETWLRRGGEWWLSASK